MFRRRKQVVDVIAEDEERVTGVTVTFQSFIQKIREEKEHCDEIYSELDAKSKRYDAMKKTVKETSEGTQKLLEACGIEPNFPDKE